MGERRSKKHYEVLDALVKFLKANKYAPSMRELMELTGVRSLSHVRFCLNRLSEEGLIAYERNKSRTLRVIGMPGVRGVMAMDARKRCSESAAKKKHEAGKKNAQSAFQPILRKDREAKLQERIELVVKNAREKEGPNHNVLDERHLRFSGSKIG